MTTATKPKKGDLIKIARIWNTGEADREGRRHAAISVRLLRVEAWGKKECRFFDPTSRVNFKHLGYPDTFKYANLGDEQTLADQIENCKREIIDRLQKSLRLDEDWLHDRGLSVKPEIADKARLNLREATEFLRTIEIEVADYYVLLSNLKDRLRSNRAG